MLVLTYGTFDLLHYGHMRLLQRASALGSRLIVGLSTDEFNAVKGKHARMSYAERAELLMACRFVDEVFPEENWQQKADDIVRLGADIFVMGDDWRGKFDDLGHLCAVTYLERTPLISSTLLREGLKGSEPALAEAEPALPPAEIARVAGGMSLTAARRAWWASYPVTLLEAALMAGVSLLAYGLLRLCYLHWWHPEQLRQRPRRMVKDVIDADAALDAMETIERIARDSRAGIYWISGTLLGLERLGRPLPHDNDLDLGLDIGDPRTADFLAALRASPDIDAVAPQGMSWKTRIQNPDLHAIPGGVIRYKTAVRNARTPLAPPVKLDLFLHFPHSGGAIHGTRNSIWWNSTPRVAQRAYGDRIFSVPEDSHRYLTENYGDYRQEVKDFENAVDCPNVMNIFSWRSLGTLLSRLQMMVKLGRIDRARQLNARIAATILKGLFPFSDKPRIAAANGRPAAQRREWRMAMSRQLSPNYGNGRRVAFAAIVAPALIAGWLIHDFTEPPSAAAADSFVDEAVASHKVLMLRDEMQSQLETQDLESAEIRRATGISMPRLPASWRIRDVQVFPSDSGPSVQLLIQTPHRGRFAMVVMKRTDTPAEGTPLLERRKDEQIAYWEQDGIAIGLVGRTNPADLLLLASELAGSSQWNRGAGEAG